MILGSPRYMSPEQASGDRAIDGRSDLYSLALVGYEMYTGEPVVQSGTPAGMLVKHITEIVPPLAQRVTGIPHHVGAAVDRGLAKDPGRRWELWREFAEAISGRALTPTREILGASLPRRQRRGELGRGRGRHRCGTGGRVVGIGPWQLSRQRHDRRPLRNPERRKECGVAARGKREHAHAHLRPVERLGRWWTTSGP